MEIIQVVPNLPPATGGLSDFSLLVAKELRDSHPIHSRFVVGDPVWHGSREIEGFFAEPTPDRTPGGLLKTLGGDCLPDGLLKRRIDAKVAGLNRFLADSRIKANSPCSGVTSH